MIARSEPVSPRPAATSSAMLVFVGVVLLVWCAGRERLVQDPGIWWHLRLGRDILASGSVPRVDTLTWTRQGTPWVDQSWLFDVGLAWVVDRWGWSAAVVLSAIGLGGIYGMFCAGLERQGASSLAAAGAVLLAVGVGALHFHCRPHLATFAGVAYTLWATRAWHRGQWRAIWIIPAVMLLWANLHGGFLACFLILATAGVGHALAGPLDVQRRRDLAALSVVVVATLLAALVNPYGFDLYRHVWGLLVTSRVTDLIQEYRPVALGGGDGFLVELLVLCLVAGPLLARKWPGRYDLAHVVVWLHFGLGSVRQAPLMAFACAPVIVVYLDGWLDLRRAARADQFPSWLVFLVANARACAAVLLLLLGLGVVLRMPLGGPSPRHWPLRGLNEVQVLKPDSRLFHDQDWGGLIEAQSEPRRLAFLDDRFELWGRQPILNYVNAMRGSPAWDEMLHQLDFSHVWIRPDAGLALRLRSDPGWETMFCDEISVLFRRRVAQASHSRPGNEPGLAVSAVAPHHQQP